MSERPPSLVRRRSPLLVLLPFLFLVLAIGHLLQRPPRGEPAAPPSQSDPSDDVAAWRGELAGARGTWLEARLSPLHADPKRQAFESSTLQRRLDLEPGQAWRLRMLWSSPRATEGAAAGAPGALGEQGPPGAEAGSAPQLAGIGLGPIEVVDAQGVAQSALTAPPAGDAVVDPLRVLLAPPPGALRPGQAADWILWGRAPGEDALVRGLLPEDDEEFRAATGLAGRLQLHPISLRRDDLDEPLARLERPAVAARKKRGSAASQTPSGEEDER